MLKEALVKTLVSNKSIIIVGFIIITFILSGQLKTVYSETQINNVPLHIVSDKMIAQKDTSMVQFTGNVKATREDSIIFADSIQIFFVSDDDNKNNETQSNVKKIVSEGNVKYTAGERQAFSDKAVYTTKDEILVLTGKSPKLITGSSFVTGKKITLFRLSGKVIVESDENIRVEAVFNPEDNVQENNAPKNSAPKNSATDKQ
jgi:lipopolysaccharide export system protein LptA